MIKDLCLLALITVTVGCVSPRTITQTTDGRPKILIKGAEKGALLFVDGTLMGQAASYSGDPRACRHEICCNGSHGGHH